MRFNLSCLLLGTTALLAATAGCSTERADTATTATTVQTSTTVDAAPKVVLVDPGAEPRRPLRIRFTPGDVAIVELTVDQAIDQSVRQGELDRRQRFDSPPITQRLAYTVGAVDDDGSANFTVEVTSALADTDGTELDAEAALLLQAELQALEGTTGEGHVSAVGLVDRFAMEPPADLDPSAADALDALDALDAQLGTFGPSLPTEPVGVGARWDITSTTAVGGAQVTTTTTFTLEELSDTQIGYTATITGTAGAQPLDLAKMTGDVELVTSETTGTSTGTQSLTGLAFTARTEATTTQEIDLDGPDGASTLRQTIESDLAARAGTP